MEAENISRRESLFGSSQEFHRNYLLHFNSHYVAADQETQSVLRRRYLSMA